MSPHNKIGVHLLWRKKKKSILVWQLCTSITKHKQDWWDQQLIYPLPIHLSLPFPNLFTFYWLCGPDFPKQLQLNVFILLSLKTPSHFPALCPDFGLENMCQYKRLTCFLVYSSTTLQFLLILNLGTADPEPKIPGSPLIVFLLFWTFCQMLSFSVIQFTSLEGLEPLPDHTV